MCRIYIFCLWIWAKNERKQIIYITKATEWFSRIFTFLRIVLLWFIYDCDWMGSNSLQFYSIFHFTHTITLIIGSLLISRHVWTFWTIEPLYTYTLYNYTYMLLFIFLKKLNKPPFIIIFGTFVGILILFLREESSTLLTVYTKVDN